MSMLAYTLLIAKKEYQYMNLHLGLTTLLMVIFVLFLTQRYGIQGASIGILLSRIIPLFPLVLFVKKTIYS